MKNLHYKEIKDKLSYIVESAASGIVITDDDGGIIFVNSSMNKMFGYPGDELLGKSIEVLVPHRFRGSPVTFKDSFIMSPSVRPMRKLQNIYALRKDGTEFPVEIGSNHVKTKNGIVVLITIVNITERKALEKKVLERTEELVRLHGLEELIGERELAEQKQTDLLKSLERVNSELKDFAHRVSHDLKAPLRAIGALADWLREDYGNKLDESGLETLDLLKGRVVRMTNLIDGILSYSSAVREEERVVEINLRMFIDEIVSGLSLPDNIKIIFETDTEVIYYGMTGLEQVFQNLLTNAIKYNDKPEGIIEIRCMKDGGDYKFSVSDNGIGIEEKYFDRIFEIFQTLAPHDKGETAGIGLAIVKKIIDNYGGKIWLESELGSGTTFYFTLPDRVQS